MSDEDPIGHLDHTPLPRSSIAATIRNLRGKYLHSIMAHDDDLSVVLRFPLGFTWRRFAGIDWCPACQSMSPRSMIEMMERIALWNREASTEEIDRLILSGDMAPIHAASVSPPSGTGYAYYNVSHVGEPMSVVVVTEQARFGFVIAHLHDTPRKALPTLFSHLNRLAPMIHWSINDNGDLQWSTVGTLVKADDDDDDDESSC